MADWTDPPWAELTAGKPWTDEKAAAAFENVIAQAEGAPGAPKVQGIALGNVFVGAFDVASTATADFTSLGRAKTIMMQIVCQTSGGISIRVALTNNGGSSWGSNQSVVASIGTNEFLEGMLVLDLETGAYSFRGSYDVTGVSTPGLRVDSGTLTVPSNCDGFRISGSSVSNVQLAGHVFIIGGVA